MSYYPNTQKFLGMNVMGVRDYIVHHYFDVDADIIFNICKEDVPVLSSVINRMIKDL